MLWLLLLVFLVWLGVLGWGAILIIQGPYAYVLLALLFNRTTLRVQRGRSLRVRHGPVPWSRPSEQHIDQISQIRVARGEVTPGHEACWFVQAIDRAGKETAVTFGLKNKAAGWEVRRWLVARLGLEDEAGSRKPEAPVQGRMPA